MLDDFFVCFGLKCLSTDGRTLHIKMKIIIPKHKFLKIWILIDRNLCKSQALLNISFDMFCFFKMTVTFCQTCLTVHFE